MHKVIILCRAWSHSILKYSSTICSHKHSFKVNSAWLCGLKSSMWCCAGSCVKQTSWNFQSSSWTEGKGVSVKLLSGPDSRKGDHLSICFSLGH